MDRKETLSALKNNPGVSVLIVGAGTGLPLERINPLFGRYGTRTDAAENFIERAPDSPFRSLPEYSRREIMFIVRQEKVRHLDDLILRRTILAMLEELNNAALNELAAITGEALGWNDGQVQAGAARTLRIPADRHRVRM